MPTVAELSGPYENHLRPVLGNGPNICDVCHTCILDGYSRCYQCSRHVRLLRETADAVGYVALAVKHEQLARELAVYKGPRLDARQRPRLGLAAILWRWLSGHETCLQNAARVQSFPLVTTVPSTSGRAAHPLGEIIGNLVGPTRERYKSLLRARSPGESSREASEDMFEVRAEGVTRGPVLLIDDTWTSGAHAQSAASALRLADFGPVAILAIGRHFAIPEREDYAEEARSYLAHARSLEWSWNFCNICDNR